MIGLDDPQPKYDVPSVGSIPDVAEDRPVEGKPLVSEHCDPFPPLVFGAASLSNQYNAEGWLRSEDPFRTVRLALRYGITAIDTSPWYGASEIILGSVLESLAPEFPRSSYKLITKCGRYGPNASGFDYSSGTVRRSVQRSLDRLRTDYLDVVFLHDVEFVESPVKPLPSAGDPSVALTLEGEALWGLSKSEEGFARGEGDRKILAALSELRRLKEEGIVRAIGITGYPLPTLLRLALLALHNPPFKPLDCILSYGHFTLQNATFAEFLPQFINRARVPRLFCASPFGMGLLTPKAPSWHPAPPELINLAKKLDRESQWPGKLPNLALGFGMRRAGPIMGDQGRSVPTVVGLSNLAEVHEAVKVWREVSGEDQDGFGDRRVAEEGVRQAIVENGWGSWSWASPSE